MRYRASGQLDPNLRMATSLCMAIESVEKSEIGAERMIADPS
jgi:hypothetical protein